MKPSIIIDVTPDGKIQMEGKEFTGKACDEKMRIFEEQLGTVKARTNKPEYFRTVAATQKVGG